MQQLIIEKFPLDGMRLIEASAGTGKTFTIAALYLRLLIERDLSVSSILVVTFTEAATEELRDRIRARIHDALLWLEGRRSDPDLPELLQPKRGDTKTIERLRDALTCMDEAAIFTIHGFCQRTLTESAFESRVLFDAEFISDESLLRQQAARDFWRNDFAGTSFQRAGWLLKQWKNPDALLDEVSVLVDNPHVELQPEVESEVLERLEQQRNSSVDELCELWRADRDEVTDLLNSSIALSRAASNYRQDNLDAALTSLSGAVEGGFDPYLLPRGFELLTTDKLQGSLLKSMLKKGETAPSHDLFNTAQQLFDINKQLDRYRRVLVLIEAAGAIRGSIDRFKSQQRVLFFDDLLNKLDQALQGEARGKLIERIRKRYPLAMIDEFQDTDPIQYRIFSTIYSGCPDCGLFMIGDPKQAIYSFRGADIFTYMKARRDTGDENGHFTLGVNWRSHSNLVGMINRLFSHAASPFIYDADISFKEVQPAGKADKSALTIDGTDVEPMVAWFVPGSKTISKKWAGVHVADGCASEIAQLLNLGREQRALLGKTPLCARDIAVLVRNRFEADDIRQALTRMGVNSITISRDSVFDADEARDLSHLLRAVAEPGNALLLRTALATRLLGWSAKRIHALGEDEDGWEAKAAAFHGYHRIWREHGFMQMLYRLMRSEGITGALLSLPDGERRMTNLLQLAELAQVASRSLPGIENLLRWLADERALVGEGECSDEQQMRLESDENLVQIVTIHKSKGMEYPLVFLPFVWSSRTIADKGIIKLHHERSHHLLADLGSAQRGKNLQLAERERLAEDLRLLYVALTRAQQRCYFSWGKFNGAAQSAMAWLLHQSKPNTGPPECIMQELDSDSIRSALDSLNIEERTEDQGGSGVRLLVTELPADAFTFHDSGELLEKPQALTFSGRVEQNWQLTSFSGLSGRIKHDYRIDLPDFDPQDASRSEAQGEPAGLSRFTFPRGARAGECLHCILEELDFPQAGAEQVDAVVARKLDQFGFEEKWRCVVSEWMQSILETPLDSSGLTLHGINSEKRFVEMEFHYPLAGLTASGLNGVMQRPGGFRSDQMQLDFNPVNGMMKGFIDLIFEHQGRFYVLDYKSNHLGDHFDHYQRDNLQTAIGEHHYDLQYLIYTVALHRYLKLRLPGYDYDIHFGGVYYLFLRGMDPRYGRERGVFHDRPESELISRLNRLFAGEESRV